MLTRVLPLLVLPLLAPGAGMADKGWCWTPGSEPRSRDEATIAFEDSVHALVVFVRFDDDTAGAPEWPIVERGGIEVLPDWAGGLLKERPEDVTAALGLHDPSLSAYFFWQSQGGSSGPHILTGEVWPRAEGTPYVFTPPRSSQAYRSGRRQGYGYLVRDVLDDLVGAPGFDLGRFDANRDGELDHLMLIVRRDPGVSVIGGVANLSGVNTRAVRTYGRSEGRLTYPSEVGPIEVDMDAFGSGAINWMGGEYAFRTLAHEYGHILFDMGHTPMITPEGAAVPSPVSNDVPADVPEGGGAYACQYNRMCGGGASGGVPFQSSNYASTVTLSGYELRRMGWAHRIVLDPARDTTNVRLRPLYHTGDVVLVPLAPGSGGDTLALESRQRTNYFDRFPGWDLDDPFYGTVYRDLQTEGLLATLSWGSPTGPYQRYLYDFLPPSNMLVQAGSRCDGTSQGCSDPYAPWEGDMLEPGVSATQITPWTRPNVSGYTLYPDGVAPNWFAVTNVRYGCGGRGVMAFDLVADVRQSPVTITADSWMGAETNGTVFQHPVRVAPGATLRVWQGATVTFAGGLDVAPGAAFVCEPGAICLGAEL